MSDTKVSILMSVYNGEKYLAEAVESMLNQSYPDFEFIIIDDASTDTTPEILAGYAEKDARIRLSRNESNLGLTKSLNKGLAMASGEYVVRMDADDVSLPHRLEKQVGFLDTHPDAVLISGWIQNIDSDGNYRNCLKKEIEPDLVNWFLMFFNYIGSHSQATYRKSVAIEVGSYDEKLRYSQDYDLWTRICQKGELHILPDVMLLYRRHEGNISVLHTAEQAQYSLNISRSMMGRIMDNPPDPDRITTLRRFWQWEFDSEDEVKNVQYELRRIFAAFTGICSGDASAGNLCKIRSLMGQQFLRWAHVLLLRRCISASCRAVLYATYWLRWRVVGRFLGRLLLPKSGAEE